MNSLFTHEVIGAPGSVSVGPPPGAPRAFSVLTQELDQLVKGATELLPALTSALEIVVRFARCDLAQLYRPHGGELQIVASRGKLVAPQQDFEQADVERVVRASLSRMTPLGHMLSAKTRHAVVVVPVATPGQPAVAIAAVAGLQQLDMAAFAMSVEYVAAAIAQVVVQDTVRRTEWEARFSAAAMELVSHVQVAPSLDEAIHRTVNAWKDFFACQSVALGWLRPSGTGVRLKAVSGLSEFDPHGESTRRLGAALDECLVRGELTAWPPLAPTERHASLAHRQLLEQSREDAVLSIPLRTLDDVLVGALIALGPRASLHTPATCNAWKAMAPHLATALDRRRLAEPTRWQRMTRGLLGQRSGWSRTRMVLALLGSAMALMAVPVPYRIATDCLAEPTLRRFVVAPYDGRLNKSLVETGDLVEEGDVLAMMDDRELRFELEGRIVERSRAAKERDTATADHDTSAAQLAELERETHDVQIKLLREREKNLAIESPLAGVVLKGDLEDAEGAPVTVGQALYEIAPLETLTLELAIPAEDIAWIQEQQPVTARLDGYHGRRIAGTIARIHPRAEIRENHHVFIADVTLPNTRGDLRPGMHGKARIHAGFRALGWIWWHKAWHRVRIVMGW
ncbi:MAG TPA: HlyD family efflux transporter periplasmic adaptor subunit [Pirellulaceae bacterium]